MKLNCKPGDLCYIVKRDTAGLNLLGPTARQSSRGRPVDTENQEPRF